MRDVVLFTFLSLDGVAEEPGDWFTEDGPELFELIGRVIATQDDVVLGRGTYEYWYEHWPTSDLEPFAPFINGVRKHVAASSELPGHWDGSTRIERPLFDHVRALKAAEGGDIGIHGSITLAASLLAEGLVDVLRLVIPPVVAGGGQRLFSQDGTLQGFELVDVERTAKGSLFLHHRLAPAA